MTANVERVLQVAQQLSPSEQLEIIQALSSALVQRYREPLTLAIPASIRRTAPITDLDQLAANFWPEDETADDIIDYIAQQRHTERLSDI